MSAAQLWKPEPLSPLLDSERDTWLFLEDEGEDSFKSEKKYEVNSPSSRAEAAQQLLDEIEDLVKEEEPFSDWFEEKINLPIFEEIPNVVPTEETHIKSDDLQRYETSSLPTFEFVLNNSQLTPPQSPPYDVQKYSDNDKDVYIPSLENVYDITVPSFDNVNLQPVYIEQNFYGNFVQQQQQPTQEQTYITLLPTNDVITLQPPQVQKEVTLLSAPPTPIPDLAQELAAVDEIVRNTAQDLDSNWDQWEGETSSSSCSSSSAGSSPTRSSTGEETDDPEWVPPLKPGKITNKTTTKRTKPYVRSTNAEDKKLRKKEQNKNAATRYRQKKKMEVFEILEEEKVLEEKNGELKQDVADITREIKYLKGLMRDLLKAKQLIK